MVAVSTYGGHAYCREEWIKNTLALTKGHDVYLLWNGPGNPKKIFPKHWKIETFKDDGMRGIDILEAKNRKQRRYFLNRKYTHFFSLESDTFPPPGTIEKFLKHDKPLLSALYWIKSEGKFIYHVDTDRYGAQYKDKDLFIIKRTMIPSVWGLTNNPPSPDNFNYNLSGMGIDEAESAQTYSRLWRIEDTLPQRGLVRILSAGIGSVLIRRDVLEQIDFRIQDGEVQQFTDFMLYWDAYRAGIKAYVDTDTIANHIHPANELHDIEKWFDAKTAKDSTTARETHQFN